LGLQKEGLKLIHKVLELDPQDVVALCSAGETFVDSGELDQALPYFLHATRVAPAHAAAWSGLGYLLLKQKKQKESLACLHKARELAPEDAMTLNRLGLSFLSDQRIPEAVSCFKDSIRVRPDFALAWSNLSVAWRQANQIRQAIDACEQALKIQPNEAATWTNLGVLLQEENAVDEALVAYRKALEVDRHFHLAHLNEGIALLLKGELPLGWLKYEYRWLLPQAQKLRHSGQPFWRGDASLLGRTILLHSDQGFGDTIQFLRYAPVLASMGAMVHVEVEAPLADLAGGVPPGDVGEVRNAWVMVISYPLVSIKAPPLFTYEAVIAEIKVADASPVLRTPPLKFRVPALAPPVMGRAVVNVPPSKLMVPSPPKPEI